MDDAAAWEVAAENVGLARHACKIVGVPQADVDECVADVGYQALHSAAVAHRPGGCKYSTFAMRSLLWATVQRQAQASKRQERVPIVALRDRAGESSNDLDLLPGRASMEAPLEDREFVALLLEGLSRRDLALVRMRFFDGLGYRRIGGELGISESRASQLLRRVLRRLRFRAAQLLHPTPATRRTP